LSSKPASHAPDLNGAYLDDKDHALFDKIMSELGLEAQAEREHRLR